MSSVIEPATTPGNPPSVQAPLSCDRSGFVGRLGAVTQLVFAGLIAGVSALAGSYSPDFVPRPIVLLCVFALPGVVGLLALSGRRAGMLLAAAAASAVGSFIAFSGVTLIFLIPTALLGAGAIQLFGSEGRTRLGSMILGGLLAAAVLFLTLAAGATALLITDEACWTMYETQGAVRIELMPFSTGELAVPSGALGTGCATGLISARGAGGGALLAIGAIGLAALGSRRRWSPAGS